MFRRGVREDFFNCVQDTEYILNFNIISSAPTANYIITSNQKVKAGIPVKYIGLKSSTWVDISVYQSILGSVSLWNTWIIE